MLQSYQDVTFPKHILQSKEPNTNSQVQVLLKLPTVLVTSLGKTFFAWLFILNENILFWLTIS